MQKPDKTFSGMYCGTTVTAFRRKCHRFRPHSAKSSNGSIPEEKTFPLRAAYTPRYSFLNFSNIIFSSRMTSPMPDRVERRNEEQDNPGIQIEGYGRKYKGSPGGVHRVTKPSERTPSTELVYGPPVPHGPHGPRKSSPNPMTASIPAATFMGTGLANIAVCQHLMPAKQPALAIQC